MTAAIVPAARSDGPPRYEITAAERFAQLAIDLHSRDGVDETIDAVVGFAVQALGCSHAGVALASKRAGLEIPAVTDPALVGIYELQAKGTRGPLIETMREHRVVRVRDVASDGRWPEWAVVVGALGVRSVLDIPLVTGSQTIGVLGLYSVEPDGFGADDEAVAHILARHASVAVATAREETQLTAAVDARKLVGQAMGILMERFAVDSDQAFAILKRYSQDNNRKLHDVARELIDTRRLPR